MRLVSLNAYPIVSFALQSLSAGQVPIVVGAATGPTATLARGPSALPAPSMKRTSTLIVLPTSANVGE